MENINKFYACAFKNVLSILSLEAVRHVKQVRLKERLQRLQYANYYFFMSTCCRLLLFSLRLVSQYKMERYTQKCTASLLKV